MRDISVPAGNSVDVVIVVGEVGEFVDASLDSSSSINRRAVEEGSSDPSREYLSAGCISDERERCR